MRVRVSTLFVCSVHASTIFACSVHVSKILCLIDSRKFFAQSFSPETFSKGACFPPAKRFLSLAKRKRANVLWKKMLRDKIITAERFHIGSRGSNILSLHFYEA